MNISENDLALCYCEIVICLIDHSLRCLPSEDGQVFFLEALKDGFKQLEHVNYPSCTNSNGET